METRSGAAVFILLVLLSGETTFAADSGNDQYNVLFIISDDLRTEPGCYGGMAQTPNLDALAQDGVLFERAYCQFPLCNPSRTSLLTGRYPLTTGVIGNRTWFGHEHPDYVSLPKLFQQQGYVTLRAGKIFHGGLDETDAWNEGGQKRIYDLRGPSDATQRLDQRPSTPRRESDQWIVLPGDGDRNADYRAADRAIALLGKYQDQPFFLGCGFENPHSPLTAPQRFYDLYDANKIPLPPDFAPRPTVPDGFPPAAIRAKNADLFIGRDASPQEAKEMIRAYLAATSFMDWNVGRVLAELDRLGLREKTIVVFWGDHGYQLGEKGKWSKAGSLYEQGARVPLVIDAPGAKGNGRPCPRIVQTVDLYPTLVELCGLQPPPDLEGRSLVPLLDDPDAEWNHPAFTIWSEDGRTATGISVRTDGWRYTEYAGSNGGAVLFDEAADPHEMHNLADDPRHAETRARLSKLVEAHRQPSAPGSAGGNVD
jgi:arylsulfatase A-like enzyme